MLVRGREGKGRSIEEIPRVVGKCKQKGSEGRDDAGRM